MIIKIIAFNENRKIGEESLDLKEKLKQRGIKLTQSIQTYLADDLTQYEQNPDLTRIHHHGVSGGQLWETQPINVTDRETSEIKTINKPISLNVKIRYDENDSLAHKWNVDLYVTIDQDSLPWNKKKLIVMHPQKLHKLPDSELLRIEWEVDGVKQPSIENRKPEP